MPREIPQIQGLTQKQGSLLTVNVSPGAFGNAEGFSDLGRGVGNLSQGILSLKKQQDKRNEELWLAKQTSALHRNMIDYEVDPNNTNSTSFMPDYMKTFDKYTEAAINDAPNPEAAARYREQARNMLDQRYGAISQRQQANSLKAEENSLDESWRTNLQTFHNLSPTDQNGANNGLVSGLEGELQRIGELYDEQAPDYAKQLKARRVEEAALAIADKDPGKSEQILHSASKYMDENRIQALLNQVQTKKEATNLVAKENFNNFREENLIRSARDGKFVPIPLEDYKLAMPGHDGQEAQVAKMRDDRQIAANMAMHAFKREMVGLRPDQKMAAAEKISGEIKSEEEQRAFANVLTRYIQDDAQLYKDPVSWQAANNPVLETIKTDADMREQPEPEGDGMVLPPLGAINKDNAAGTPEQEAARFQEEATKQQKATGITRVQTPDEQAATAEAYARNLLRFQGPPPEGDANAKFYMNLPRSDRHLLTKGEAVSYAKQINEGGIDGAIRLINQIASKYPADDLQAQILSDLQNLPNAEDRIHPSIAFAFQNKDQPWLPKYMGAIRGAKDIEKLATIDSAKLKQSIATNKDWLSYVTSVNGPNNERLGDIAGAQSAVETYAKSFIAAGQTPEKAVETAITHLLKSTMSSGEVVRAGMINTTKPDGKSIDLDDEAFGSPYFHKSPKVWIPRQPTGWNKTLSDSEIENYAKRMGTAIANIHPNDVDPQQFGLDKLTDDYKRKRAIHTQIVKTGQYYPEPGGAYYRLTVAGKDGGRVDLRDKNGKFFRLPLDQVPTYAKKQPGMDINSINPNNWKFNVMRDEDYPMDDLNSDGFPNTGKFWQHVD